MSVVTGDDDAGECQHEGTGDAVTYRIRHETRYDYAVPVSVSRHVLHLLPRDCAWQQVHDAELQIAPAPAHRVDGSDPFGNPETRIAFSAPHDSLLVASRLRLTVGARPLPYDGTSGPAWEAVQASLRLEGDAPLEPRQYRFESPHVRVKHELASYALASFTPGRPLLAATGDLVARIHREFRYDPDATHIGTSVMDLLAQRRGVCQDFAHFAIACLRSLGLAARYVSGYLCTEPPPGSPRLVGADASHAWFALWCPGAGWVEFDPTNDCRADTRHILLAQGRDFGDVSPLRGVIQGGGAHTLAVAVTVLPEAS
jgi:transglutaminase-like putative cysteine protease